MAIISQRFHDIKTKFHAVTAYRSGRYSVYHICTKYHISKASLMRWNKVFDGTIDSLKEKAVDHILPIQIAIPFLKSVQSKD